MIAHISDDKMKPVRSAASKYSRLNEFHLNTLTLPYVVQVSYSDVIKGIQ
jgi:hypothetical protein